MPDLTYTIWIILLPFIAFIVIGLGSKSLPRALGSGIAVMGIGISFILSLITAKNYFLEFGKNGEVYQKIIATKYTWLHFTENLSIDLGVLLDPISVMMLLVISTISLLVFIYSVGYMKEEKGSNRFFALLSLFSFSMMGLVVATNIFQMYIFWELVGVSSYLLIGFYFTKPAAIKASKKAFIVTRFADLGFLIGILLISYHTQTFDFAILTAANTSIFESAQVTFMGLSVISWSLLLIFAGGDGKSAMFPLHIWLPDAMEGPTPVSALIHAATMVVAGVYLVARLFPVYYFQSPEILMVIGFIGAFSALFAALIACVQTDIKRILAFSTMSQIGYMMLALGVSGYGDNGLGFTASMFHLFTHAFFKALLFLGAGAIIHAVHSNSIFEMGALRKKLPVVHITFLIACLAIAGIPPLAGFFSKDEILAAAYMGNKLVFVVGLLVAGLTAFYMFRLYFLVFWNEPRYSEEPHRSSYSMVIPLVILAVGSISAGFLPFGNFVSSDGTSLTSEFHLNIVLMASGLSILGIATAAVLYKSDLSRANKIKETLGGFYQTVYHKFYFDEIYLFITTKIIFNLISRPIAWFDKHIVDGTVNAIAFITDWISEEIKELQSGQVQQYAFVFAGGAILFGLLFLYLWI